MTGLQALIVFATAAGLAGAVAAAWWVGRCHHPNPHYVRADATSGTVAEPAHYLCYECGRSWPVVQRDPGWTPTGIVQKFSGHDPLKASQALMRATIEAEQRRFLAVNRARVSTTAPVASPRPAVTRRRRVPSNVVDINSRRPA